MDCDVTNDDADAGVTLETPVHFTRFDRPTAYSDYAAGDLALARRAYWRLGEGCFLCGCETASSAHTCNGWVRVHCAGNDYEEHEALAYAELRVVRANASPLLFLPRLYLKLVGKCRVLAWALNLLEVLRAACAARLIADAELPPLPLLAQKDQDVSVFAMEAIASHYASVAPPDVLGEMMLHASRLALLHGPVACVLPRPERAKDVVLLWQRLVAIRVPLRGARLSDEAAKLSLHKLFGTGLREAERGELSRKIDGILRGTEHKAPPELQAPHVASFFRSMRAALEEHRRQWVFSREHLCTGVLHANALADDLAFMQAITAVLGRNVLYSTEVVLARP